MCRALIVLAAGPLIVTAADFWKDKQPSEWSSKEVRRLLTNSPWAKEVTLEGSAGAMPARGGRGMRGGGARGGEGRPSGGGGMGGRMSGADAGPGDMGGARMPGESMEGGGGRMGGDMGAEPPAAFSAPKVIVRWETAAPIRDASRAAEIPWAGRIGGWEQQFYVITASGVPFGGRQQMDPERVQQLQQRLLSGASLTPKGKSRVAPERVFVASAPGGTTLIFLFPRSAAISADDKDVTFETAAGALHIKAKFNPRDMAYHGKLAL